MGRKLVLAAAVLLLTTAPTFADPFGYFDGTVEGETSVTGVVGIVGWALDANGIADVEIFVDGISEARAVYGKERLGVTQQFPGFPDSAAPGFAYNLNTTRHYNGTHVVSVRATSIDGTQTWLGEVELTFMNASHLLAPFGQIIFPNEHAELRGACDLADPFRRYTVVEGWALDAGVERGSNDDPPGDAGVAYVELLIDGGFWANSQTDCHYDEDKGGLSDCRGLRSRGIEKAFRFLPDAPHARFRFVLDVGFLLYDPPGLAEPFYTPGSHVITIRSGDKVGNVANIDEMVVTFTCDEFLGNENSFGKLEIPPGGLAQSGMMEAVGWALDWEGVARIEIWANGHYAGDATHGIIRRVVRQRYPGYPDSAGPGFSLFIDTTSLPDGQRLPDGPNDFQAYVIDIFGERTLIGERTIWINNEAP